MNWVLAKNLEEIFSNLIQTLTSEARVLNPKACGVQGRSPGGGCGTRSPPPKKKLADWINPWAIYPCELIYPRAILMRVKKFRNASIARQ